MPRSARRLDDIVADRRAVGDRPFAGPRLERDIPACTCRSRSGCRDSGTGPRFPRSPRGPPGWRSSCRGSPAASAPPRRCRTGPRRRSGRRNVEVVRRPFGDASGGSPCSTVPRTVRAWRWCPGAGSNHRHRDFQSRALPTELPGHAIRGPAAVRSGASPSRRLPACPPRPGPAHRRAGRRCDSPRPAISSRSRSLHPREQKGAWSAWVGWPQ